jgi:hypothetical protein
MNINWPAHGPIQWRANVKATDKLSGGGYRTIGGFAVDAQGLGSGCSSGDEPKLWPGGATAGSSWTIKGKWQFTNNVNATTGDIEWEGRYDSADGFHYEVGT